MYSFKTQINYYTVQNGIYVLTRIFVVAQIKQIYISHDGEKNGNQTYGVVDPGPPRRLNPEDHDSILNLCWHIFVTIKFIVLSTSYLRVQIFQQLRQGIFFMVFTWDLFQHILIDNICYLYNHYFFFITQIFVLLKLNPLEQYSIHLRNQCQISLVLGDKT